MYHITHSKSYGSSILLSHFTVSLFLLFLLKLNKNTLCTKFILDHFILVVFMLHKNYFLYQKIIHNISKIVQVFFLFVFFKYF